MSESGDFRHQAIASSPLSSSSSPPPPQQQKQQQQQQQQQQRQEEEDDETEHAPTRIVQDLTLRAEELEAELEQYMSFPVGVGQSQPAVGTKQVQHVLEEIANTYEKIVTTKSNACRIDDGCEIGVGSNSNNSSVADSLLDWVIACKRSQKFDCCVVAHLRRMSQCPEYAVTDAVRLLGLRRDVDLRISGHGIDLTIDGRWDGGDGRGCVEEYCPSTSRLFCVDREGDNHHGDDDDDDDDDDDERDDNVDIYRPAESARTIGVQVRKLFEERDYTYRQCRSLLVPFVEEASFDEDAHVTTTTTTPSSSTTDRMYSGNSFFNHRHEMHKLRENKIKHLGYDETYRTDGLEMLTTLFLFGLAVSRYEVEQSLGHQDVNTLQDAGLLIDCVGGRHLVVAEVQIFPISQSDLYGVATCAHAAESDHVDCNDYDYECNNNDDDDGRQDRCLGFGTTYLFMTDWPMESLRWRQNAVMPVGYDTLELLSLSSSSSAADGARGRRHHLLDLCCGCGIQGLFAWCCAASYDDKDEGDGGGGVGFDGIVSVDINLRACLFACGNMALNSIGKPRRRRQTQHLQWVSHDEKKQSTFYVIHGDLYDPIRKYGPIFGRILSNPPFVPIPIHGTMTHLNPELYAAGGGTDGMDILRRILNECFDFMVPHDNDTYSDLLMVTEVPNVASSCDLIRGCLPEKVRDGARIRVAYVESDVEQVHDYVREREEEEGKVVPNRDWLTPLRNEEIYDRALVLISISRSRGDEPSVLHKYISERGTNSKDVSCDNADEEDAFLTKEGIDFVITSLL